MRKVDGDPQSQDPNPSWPGSAWAPSLASSSSDRPEAVKQELLRDPQQAPQEVPGLSPEPWRQPQTWHPAQSFFSASEEHTRQQPQSLLPGEARVGPGLCS